MQGRQLSGEQSQSGGSGSLESLLLYHRDLPIDQNQGSTKKRKLQYFAHLTRRAHSLEKALMLGKMEGKRSRGRQRMRWLDGITDSTDRSLSKLREILKARKAWRCSPWGRKEFDTTERLNNDKGCTALSRERP